MRNDAQLTTDHRVDRSLCTVDAKTVRNLRTLHGNCSRFITVMLFGNTVRSDVINNYFV